jgi:hypothetical protein
MSLVESKLRHDDDDDDPLAVTRPNGLHHYWPVVPFPNEPCSFNNFPSHKSVVPPPARPVPKQHWATRLFLAVTVILVIAITVQRQYVASSSSSSASTSSSEMPSVLRGNDSGGDGCAMMVTKFVLWDATTNERLDTEPRLQLTDHAALCAGDLPAKINIEAVVVVETGQAAAAAAAGASMCANTTTTIVTLDLLGTPPRHRTENTGPPFMLAGHNQGRVFKMNLPVGPYALSAMVNDHLSSRLEVSFRVFDC